MSNVNIAITGVSSGAMLYRGINNENGNCFIASINNAKDDSLLIEASHIGYITYRKTLATKSLQQLAPLHIYLVKNAQMLPTVEVQPPMWRRDDTTYYNVNSFKEGEERNLSDLLQKMPGFDIDKDGRLTYKGKEVKKIKLNGAEVFADRIQTLLQNMPLHVLQTVEARENQPDNKLTAGLQSGTETEINLALKKDTKQHLFGQVTAEGGLLKRYAFTPVAFSLLPGYNAGFIGNFNNMGRFSGYFSKDYTVRNAWHNYRNTWLRNEPSFATIFLFDEGRYIRNTEHIAQYQQQIDLSKKVVLKTEIALFENRQRQQINSMSATLTGNGLIERSDTSNIFQVNRLYMVKNNFVYQPSANRELLVNTEYTYEKVSNSGLQHIVLNNLRSTVTDTTGGHAHSIIMDASFTNRLNNNKALVFSAGFSLSDMNRMMQSQGNKYTFPAALPVTGNGLSTKPRLTLYKFLAGVKFMTVSGNRRTFSPELVYEASYARLGNRTVLYNSGTTAAIYPVPMLSNEGHSGISYLYAKGKQYWLLGKSTRNLSVEVAAGAAQLLYDRATDSEKYFPYLESTINYGNTAAQSKLLIPTASIKIENNSPYMYQLHPFYFPVSIRSFSAGGAALQPSLQWTANASVLNFKTKKAGNTGSFFIFYQHHQKSQVTELDYISLLQLTNTTMVNKTSYNGSVNFSQQLISMATSSLINIQVAASAGKRYVLYNQSIGATLNYGIHTELSIKRNWNKKYYVRLYDRAIMNIFKRPGVGQVEGINTRSVNNQLTFWQRVVLTKTADVQLSADWYLNNLFTPRRQSFFYMECKGNWNIGERWGAGLAVMNILNAKGYMFFSNSASGQSFFHIPLISRNAFVSINWKF
ncbi:hypothetical protein GCM10027516_36900 [Niabella aquatica]